MDRNLLARRYSEKQQLEILSQIVDAMVEAQDELAEAGSDEFAQILRSSCRDLHEPVEGGRREQLALC